MDTTLRVESHRTVSEGGLDHRNVAPLRIAGVHAKTVPRFNVSLERRADSRSDRAEYESPQCVSESLLLAAAR